MAPRHEITPGEILAMDDYEKVRQDRKIAIAELKKDRRVPVGPDATFYFESYDTMLHQVHEMLYIERAGEDQIPDELRAYNPLVPNGRELVATLMFEIDEPARRAAFLAGLGGVEEKVTLSFAGETVTARPEEDVDRTTADGKASSVQFLHFPFTEGQVEKFRALKTEATLAIGHHEYEHMAKLPDAVRQALSADFD